MKRANLNWEEDDGGSGLGSQRLHQGSILPLLFQTRGLHPDVPGQGDLQYTHSERSGEKTQFYTSTLIANSSLYHKLPICNTNFQFVLQV